MATDFNVLYYRPFGTFNGSPCGLTDLDGREIVPTEYSWIQYCGNGLFIMIGIDPKDRYRVGKDVHIFNSDGDELQYSLPEGTELSAILSLGNQADANLEFKVKNFSKSTVLEFYKGDLCGLCKPDGRVILPLQSETVEFWMPGFAFMDDGRGNANPTQVRIIDLNTEKSYLSARGVIPRDLLDHTRSRWRDTRIGNVVRIPLATSKATFTQLSFDRLKKTVDLDIRKFDAGYWSHDLDRPVTRQEMFSRFLQEYDLIGMAEDRVFDLLGDNFSAEPIGYKGEFRCVSYVLQWSTGCVPYPPFVVKIHFNNGVVDYWQFCKEQGESAPVTSNVILVPKNYKTINLTSFPEMRAK